MIYCLEVQHLQEFIRKPEFKEIKDIKYPKKERARRELNVIKKGCIRHKKILQGVIKESVNPNK